MSRHKIIKGDCLKKLKDIKDESVDLIFTDPPYNERYNYRNSGFKDFNNNYYDFLLSVLKECQRILKDKKGSIYVKHSSRQIDAIIPLLNKYFKYRNLIIWNNSSQSHPKKNYDSFYEPIYFYTKTDEYIFNKKSELREQPPGYWNTKGFKFVGLLNNIWSDIKMIPGGCVRKKEAELHGSLKCHPCQMPEKLAERAIKISSNENDIILDPFLGSGTTLVACEKLNRNGLGIEISKEYCKLSYQRLQKEVNQLKFGREKSIIEKIGF